MQEHLFKHFNSMGHNGFLKNVSITVINRTDGKDSKMREDYTFFFLQQKNLFSRVSIFLTSQPAITCSKLTIETLEQGVKYVQS